MPGLTPVNSLRQQSVGGSTQFYTRMHQEPDPAREGQQPEPSSATGNDEGDIAPTELDLNSDDQDAPPDASGIRRDGADVRLQPITGVAFSFRNTADKLPEDRSTVLQDLPIPPTHHDNLPVVAFHWDAPNICYRRLYFEDPVLERYGVSSCRPQEVLRSAVHFSSSWMLWPGRMLLDWPGACDTPLGYCRPGSPVGDWRERLLTR